MKITIFVSHTYPYIGNGIGNVAQKQAEILSLRGHEISLVSSNLPKTENTFTHNGVKHIKLPGVYFLEKFHIPVPIYIFNFQVIKLIMSSDIIHIHDCVYPSSFLAAIIAKVFNKKIILTQHVAFVKYPSYIINFIQKIAYATIGRITFILSDKIIYFNPNVKKLIKSYKKEILIPNGVDLQLFHPSANGEVIRNRKKLHLPLNQKIILFVGRLVPKKGYKLIFEARNTKYLLLFVGNGEVPEHMKNDKNVIFLPAQKQTDLALLYRLSDIFILPSYGEGFPLSIQEAMASGLPIITSKENIFDKSINFIKTIDLDSNAIQTAIIEIISHPKLAATMADKSYRYANANYDWKKNIDKLLKLYTQISL